MNMKLLILTAVVGAGGLVYAKTAGSNTATGTVQRFLMNPEGDVDGFLLSDGVQVNFPPHMSTSLTAAVTPKDKVTLTGTRENEKVFKADTIKNETNGKSVVEAPPEAPAGGPGEMRPPHKGPKEKKMARQNMEQSMMEGKIQTQLFGRRGEVTGAILADDSLVRVGPKLIDQSGVKMDVGQTVSVKGFATKTPYGQVIEATEIKNK